MPTMMLAQEQPKSGQMRGYRSSGVFVAKGPFGGKFGGGVADEKFRFVHQARIEKDHDLTEVILHARAAEHPR